MSLDLRKGLSHGLADEIAITSQPLIERIRAHDPTQPVVLMTGVPQEDMDGATNGCPAEVLIKPIDIEQLLSLMRVWLHQ